MFRKILYVVLGVPVGVVTGLIVALSFGLKQNFFVWVVVTVGAVVGWYVAIVLSEKVNASEVANTMQTIAADRVTGTILPAPQHSYVAGVILGGEFAATVLIYAVLLILFRAFYSFDQIFSFVLYPNLLAVPLFLSIMIFAAWIGVKYADQKNLLAQECSRQQLISQIFIGNFVIYFSVQNIIAGVIGAVVSTAAIHYFLKMIKPGKEQRVT